MSDPRIAGRGARWIWILNFTLTLCAAGLLLGSLKLPLWQMRMEAPQYRDEEALRVKVLPNEMRGDLQELALLNQYIGVQLPKTLPQFKWLPAALVTGAVLGAVAGLLPGVLRRYALLAVCAGLSTALLSAAIQAKSQMHDIGHNRDRHAAMAGFKDFTPPLLGSAKIAQFEVNSRLGGGAWLIGGALAMQLAASLLSRPASRQQPPLPSAVRPDFSTLSPASSRS